MAGDNIIYVTAFGRTFAEYAHKLVYTLRHPRLGNYSDRIWLFTDEPDDPVWRRGPLATAETRRLDLPPDGDRLYWALRARITAGLALDHSAYYRIAYMDCDVMAQRDLAPFFDGPD